MLFRVELARPLPADKNRLNVIQKRVEYGNWFIHLAIVRHCMFVDECGFNIWTARSHRRASIGEGTYRQLCEQRGGNITVCMAISHNHGLVISALYK